MSLEGTLKIFPIARHIPIILAVSGQGKAYLITYGYVSLVWSYARNILIGMGRYISVRLLLMIATIMCLGLLFLRKLTKQNMLRLWTNSIR